MTPKQKPKDNTPGASVQPPAPTPTPAVKQEEKKEVVPAVSRQDAMLAKLKEAWVARGVNLEKLTATQDGKFLNIVVGEGWPTIRLGAGGGIELPQLRSYPKAWDAALIADQLLAKQNDRDQKRAIAAAAAAPKTKETKQPEVKQSPAAKKATQHEQLEKQLQHA